MAVSGPFEPSRASAAELQRTGLGERLLLLGSPLRRHRRLLMLGLPLSVFGWIWVAFMTADERWVWSPGIAVVSIAALFVTTLWDRDRRLPVFELGTLTVAATVVYALFPLMNFTAGGYTWSDGRLLQYAPTPRQVGVFAWNYAIYLASFAVVYLVARGGRRLPMDALVEPPRSTRVVLFGAFLAAGAFILSVQTLYGVQFNPSYAEVLAGEARGTSELPYVLQQIANNVWGILFALKLGLLTILFARWRHRGWRLVLLMWVSAEIAVTVLRLGARAHLVLMLLACILLYHRLVRPLTARRALTWGVVLLGGFILLGLLRQYRGDASVMGENLAHAAIENNEFQVLFGTAYDLAERRRLGSLGEVPWQVYVSEAYLIIPSQLLPFYKWYAAEWYLEVLGVRGQGQGYMFGVLSHAAIGLGWIELIFRGAALGLIFALIHRIYAGRSSSFWWTFFYLFLCIWAYYTFRASTFEIVYVVVYRFVPILVLTEIGALLIRPEKAQRIPSDRPSHAAPQASDRANA